MAFTGESRGHLKVRTLLTESGFAFKEEYEFEGLNASSGRPLRFDFMVFDDDGNPDFAIEVNGEQHYEPVAVFGGKKGLRKQRYNDKQKAMFCTQRRIPLVNIPHWELDMCNLDYIMEKAGI